MRNKEFIKKIKYLLNKKEKKSFFFLLILTIFASFLEYLSFASLFPSILLITNNNIDILNDGLLKNIYTFIFFETENPLITFIYIFFILYLVKIIILTTIIIFQNKIIYRIKFEISKNLSLKYLSLDLLTQIKKKTSKLVANLTDEVAQVGQIFLNLTLLITDIFLILAILIFIFFLDLYLTFIIFIVLIFIIFIYQITVKKIVSIKAKDRQIHLTEKIKFANFLIRGFKEIKIFQKEQFFLNKFNYSSEKNFKSLAFINIIQSLPRVIIEFILLLLVISFILFIFFNNLKLDQYLPILSMYVFATLRLLPMFVKIASILNLINFSKPSLKIIYDELKNKSSFKKYYKINDKQYVLKKNLEVKNLTFKYGNKKIINNKNLKIKKNSITVIAGRSGSGKSTLINIIVGLIDSYRGKVLIDGINIKKIKRTWMNSIGYIPQDINLNDASIRENIAFGEQDEKISNNKIMKIINYLKYDRFISHLKKGIYTNTGEAGKYISGGQIQKIAISRALYKNCSVLIFDEPTSSLDKLSVQDFLKVIKKLSTTKTIVIVSHDPIIIKSFDNIIYL